MKTKPSYLVFFLTLLLPIFCIGQSNTSLKTKVSKEVKFSSQDQLSSTASLTRDLIASTKPEGYASDYQIKADLILSITNEGNSLEKTELVMELEKLNYKNIPTYEGADLKQFFVPSKGDITVRVVGADTSFTVQDQIDLETKTANKTLYFPDTAIVSLELADLDFTYQNEQVESLENYIKNIDDLLATRNIIQTIETELKAIKLPKEDPDKIISNKEKYDGWLESLEEDHYKRTFWEMLPEEYIAKKELPTLKKAIDRKLENKGKQIKEVMSEVQWLYYERGLNYFEKKQYEQAEEDAQKALNYKEYFVPALALQSELAWKQEGLAAALPYFNEANEHLSVTNTKEKNILVALGDGIKNAYLKTGDRNLSSSSFESAINYYNLLESFCNKYTIIDCQNIDITEKRRIVRQAEYDAMLQSINKNIQNAKFTTALEELDSAKTVYYQYQVRNIGQYDDLSKMANTGRWKELYSFAELAQDKAVKALYNDYDSEIQAYEVAAESIKKANVFFSNRESLIQLGKLYSDELLVENWYNFHLHYAMEYAQEDRVESLDQFKLAKQYTKEETQEYFLAYKKVNNEEHLSIVTYIDELRTTGISTGKKEEFEDSYDYFKNAIRKTKELQDFEANWLSDKPNDLNINSDMIFQEINQEIIDMTNLAIDGNTNTKQYIIAKQYNEYLIEAGGDSRIFFIEKAEFEDSYLTGKANMEEQEYETAIDKYERAIQLYIKHRFDGYNEQLLKQDLKNAASSYASARYYVEIEENKESLESLQEIKESINDWGNRYKLRMVDAMVDLNMFLETTTGNTVAATNQLFQADLKEAINDKNYINAQEIVQRAEPFLEQYDGLYDMDFTNIKTQIPLIDECAEFQRRSDFAISALHEKAKDNPYTEIKELFYLESLYNSHNEIRQRISPPYFIPTYDYLIQQDPNIIYYTARVYEEEKNIEVAYRLLKLAFDKKFSPSSTVELQELLVRTLSKNKALSKEYIEPAYDLLIYSIENGGSYYTESLQRSVGSLLSKYDKEVLSKKKGKALDNRIPKSLKKKMKVFKKAYKKSW